MKFKLSDPGQFIIGSTTTPFVQDSQTRLKKNAIVVHAGPEGTEAKFLCSNGEISFTSKRIQNVVNVHNARIDMLAQEYGTEEAIPIGAYRPILDSHSDESNDKTIGRLTGRLKFEIRDVPGVGKNVACAIAVDGITFLGKDTVDKVIDGRIYHLSVGITAEDAIDELSTVVTPAAAGAMLLKKEHKKEKQPGKKNSMDAKLKEIRDARRAKLAEAKSELNKMQTKAAKTLDGLKLAAKKNTITESLKRLCAAGKVSPAEIKTILSSNKVSKLAAMDDAAISMALELMGSREGTIIRMGQNGSTNVAAVMDVGKHLAEAKAKHEHANLKAEIKKDLSKLAFGKENKKTSADDSDKDKGDKKSVSDQVSQRMAENDDGDDSDENKKAKADPESDEKSAKLAEEDDLNDGDGSEKMAIDTPGLQATDNMSAFRMEVDEMKTQIARLAGIINDLMGDADEEDKHFGTQNDDQSFENDDGKKKPSAAKGQADPE